MPERLVLWGPPVVERVPADPDYAEFLPGWVQKCADVGVAKIIGGDKTLALTEAAHAVGIKVDPYVNYNSFPRHGSARVRYGWSLDFLRPPVTADEARAIMDRHRPIFDNPQVGTSMTDFARQNPQYRSFTRDRSYTLQPGEDLYLSPAFPEVRAEQTQLFVETLAQTQGDGIQVEFVLGNEDENGAVTYGYEDRTVAEFQAKHGEDPFDLPNDDRDWLQFRADYVTLALTEMRAAVKQENPDAVFSTTLIAGEKEDYLKLLHDWPAWIEQGLIDEFYIWFRTNSDLDALERQLGYAVDVAAGRTPVIAELSCYHPGSFQEPDLMLRAAEVAMGCGADGVGIYRSHAVEQLNFWPVLEKMAKL
ncbi:MAG: family 10 glycosylhydrolase [Caldilineaceae bacterium]|nr:family 10 glycosylhydrolase [Caldilineaceae bacterium]